jgi:uncharacterized membrane protein YbhN (UPF0104 family)
VRRRWLVIAASLALAVALAKAAGFGTVAQVWRTLDLRGPLVSIACYYASLAIRVASWRRLLGPGAPAIRALAPPLALGFVVSHVAPAKAGEPVAALLAARALRLPLATTLAVLTAERALHVVTLLATFAPAAALAAGEALSLSRAARAAAFLLAATLAALPLLPAVLRRATRLAARQPRSGAAAAAYLTSLASLLRSPSRVAPLAALSAGFWLLQYLSLAAILRAGDVDVNLLQAAAVAGAAVLGGTLSLLPLGTQDGISALALGAFGVPLARGFALALFHTLLGILCGAALAAALAGWALRQGNGSREAP